jgi:STE24 endopeptidase
VNVFASIILATLLIKYFIDWYATKLNLQALSETVPPEFADVYDNAKYTTSVRYIRTRTAFSQITTTFDLIVLLVFWYAGGFAWLDTFSRSYAMGPIGTGLLFISALLALQFVLTIPFSWYSTFVIEEHYGFNKSSLGTFISDRVKGIALYVILGLPVLALVLWFFEATGPNAWLYCWIAITVLSFIAQLVAPSLIFPLFNKFTPLGSGQLRDAIIKYTEKVQFPVKGLFVIDGSRRSSRANAFFTGIGKFKRIALFDTLIANHTIDELVAVLAHEVGHNKRHHVPKQMLLGFIQQGVMLFILSLFLQSAGLFEAFGVAQTSVHAGLVFFMLLYTPIDLATSILGNLISRSNEYAADEYAARTTNDTSAMISALKKLSSDNYAHLTPHPFYVFLNYSHPTTLQRVRALAALR